MANYRKLTATTDVNLGVAGGKNAGIITFQVANIGGGNIVPKTKLAGIEAAIDSSTPGSPVAAASVFSFASCAYRKAGDESWVAAGTPITVDGLYEMNVASREALLTVNYVAGAISIGWDGAVG